MVSRPRKSFEHIHQQKKTFTPTIKNGRLIPPQKPPTIGHEIDYAESVFQLSIIILATSAFGYLSAFVSTTEDRGGLRQTFSESFDSHAVAVTVLVALNIIARFIATTTERRRLQIASSVLAFTICFYSLAITAGHLNYLSSRDHANLLKNSAKFDKDVSDANGAVEHARKRSEAATREYNDCSRQRDGIVISTGASPSISEENSKIASDIIEQTKNFCEKEKKWAERERNSINIAQESLNKIFTDSGIR